jgi:hypothetical protein
MECPQWRSSAGLLTGNYGRKPVAAPGWTPGPTNYRTSLPEATVSDGWNWIQRALGTTQWRQAYYAGRVGLACYSPASRTQLIGASHPRFAGPNRRHATDDPTIQPSPSDLRGPDLCRPISESCRVCNGDHASHIASWLERQYVQLDRSAGWRR